MNTQIGKWGNSLAVRIPGTYAKELQLKDGMDLEVTRLDDGLLDACFVRKLNKLRLLRLFPAVFRGSHIGMKEVEYRKATRVRIQTDPVMEIFADGEYVCSTPVEIGVQRDALRVILGV